MAKETTNETSEKKTTSTSEKKTETTTTHIDTTPEWLKSKSETYKTLGFDNPQPYKIFRNVTEDSVKKQASKNCGFYYDSQINDPFLSITLHANTVMKEIKENGQTKDYQWVLYDGDCLEPITPPEVAKASSHYAAEPLARCILTEDFAYQITNNFTDNNMGNAIESMFESFKPYAPILGKIGKIEDAAADVSKANDFGGWSVSVLNGLAKKAAPWFSSMSSFLNKALMVQGTRFSYYNGTQFNFNNLEMKYTVFSEYDSNGVFYTVDDHIQKLSPYVMGTYHTLDNYEKSSELLDKIPIDAVKKFIRDYVGIQDPPGGFEMDEKLLSNILKGTLRLNIGGVWALENLVLKNMAVNMSKVQAKDPRSNHQGETVPLYAEIILQLAPAAVTIETGWRNIIQHKGLKTIRNSVSRGYQDAMRKLGSNSTAYTDTIKGSLDTSLPKIY